MAGRSETGEGEYTKDGSVDLKGRPVLRSKSGGWTACFFVVESSHIRHLEQQNDSIEKTIAEICSRIPELRISEQLQKPEVISWIEEMKKKDEETVCSLNPKAFWERHVWEYNISYLKAFDERKIHTKSKAVQMP